MECRHCGATIIGRRAKLYCNASCAAGPKRTGPAQIAAWLAGDLAGHTGRTLRLKRWVRDWVLQQAGHACERSGWAERHPIDDRPLVEVDHLDGDAGNDRPDNLRVLCPNCHAMTSTFRRRNAGSKRQR